MTVSRCDLVDGALGLAARGIPVIPLRRRSKVPIHRNWQQLGLLDPDAIRQQWRLNPDSNVGVLCGGEAFEGRGLTVVDVDLPDGPEALERLEEEHYGCFPVTSAVSTPSGGMHYYLAGVTPSWNPGPGLEIRSAGRQCVAPPSIHPNGGQYTWWQETEPLKRLPAWLEATSCDPAPLAKNAATFTPSGLRDPVLEVPPPTYFRELCGLTPNRQGFVPCPLHAEATPSCRVYDTPERGWFCYGASCQRGGDVVTLAAELAGMPTSAAGL